MAASYAGLTPTQDSQVPALHRTPSSQVRGRKASSKTPTKQASAGQWKLRDIELSTTSICITFSSLLQMVKFAFRQPKCTVLQNWFFKTGPACRCELSESRTVAMLIDFQACPTWPRVSTAQGPRVRR